MIYFVQNGLQSHLRLLQKTVPLQTTHSVLMLTSAVKKSQIEISYRSNMLSKTLIGAESKKAYNKLNIFYIAMFLKRTSS